MGYKHIDNLYKYQAILDFKQCYALEKIHGTSQHISWSAGAGALSLFPGGNKMETMLPLFNLEELKQKFIALGHDKVTIFGEGYGGKCQGMSATYGKETKFVAFEVRIGETWLNVPNAHDVCNKLGIEFVDYVLIDTTLENIDRERDKPSVQAVRNGILEPKMREGVVLRPLNEVLDHRGNRIVAKHKRAEFSERATTPEVDPAKRAVLESAGLIAMEWVTDMRLRHVLDKLPECREPKDIPVIIKAMQEDIYREAKGEIVESPAVLKAIGNRTVKLFKQQLMEIS